MFERFLHTQSGKPAGKAPAPASTITPKRPAPKPTEPPLPPAQSAEENVSLPAAQAPIETVAPPPATDSIPAPQSQENTTTPNETLSTAEEPLHPTQNEETLSAEEDISSSNESIPLESGSQETDEQTSISSDEKEDPEEALPVEQMEDETPPEPPSFLKASENQSSPAQSVESEPESDSKEESQSETVESTGPLDMSPGVLRGHSLHTVDFSDIWYTPEGVAYVRNTKTRFALIPIETEDLEDFHKALEQGFTGMSSYAVRFAGDSYRVERVNT